MSITYPLAMPATPGFSALVLEGFSNAAVSASPYTGQQQVYEWPATWWEAQVSLPPMRKTSAEAWIGFLLSLRGRVGTFLLGDPTFAGHSIGSASHAGTAALAKAIALKGFSANAQNVLVAGDYIQVGSGTTQRIYKVVKSVNADASGNCSVDVFPNVREAIANNATLTTTAYVKGVFRLKSGSSAWSIDRAKIYGISFEAVEAI